MEIKHSEPILVERRILIFIRNFVGKRAWLARRRERKSINVRRLHRSNPFRMCSKIEVKINERGTRIAEKHLGPIKCINAGAVELAGGLRAIELVYRHVISIPPGPEVRIIREVLPWPWGRVRRSLGWRLESIDVVRAGRITRFRHRDTFVEGRGIAVGKVELRNDPAIGHPVVLRDRVSALECSANPTEL